jgi:5,6-dimethylbenzimidazole synthase
MSMPPVFDEMFRERLTMLFRWRRDVRHFRADPIPRETLDRLLRSACLAPSVGLSEPWRFVQVDAPERRQAIRDVFSHCNRAALLAIQQPDAARYAALKLAGLDQAPCQLAVFAEPDPVQGGGLGRQTMPETTAYSATMALHTLWLAARAEGIGLGWVSILDPAEVTRVLDVPSQWRFIAYVCIGWPDAEDDVPELERAGWERRNSAPPALLQR